MKKIFTLGLMSGTSVDAIDASLLLSEGKHDALLLHLQFPYQAALRREILSLAQDPRLNLEELTRLHYKIGAAFAAAAEKTIKLALKKNLLPSRKALCAIGCHGQTIYHSPAEKRTLQIGEAALVPALTGITTVSDFRAADTAAGGEGAPLLPYYHRRLFASRAKAGLAVHNLGGISNFTYVGPGGVILALDTGPANCLLDGAIQEGRSLPFDKGGALAASGKVNPALLAFLKNHPSVAAFRRKKAPKSTGRELFSPQLLSAAVKAHPSPLPDLLRTLTEFTVDLIVDSYEREVLRHHPLKTVVIAGGGAKNAFLLSTLSARMPAVNFCTMEDVGWNSQALESQAFGYFAWMALAGIPLTFPSTTGAAEAVICGKISRAMSARRPASTVS